jgi:hypothetical protein
LFDAQSRTDPPPRDAQNGAEQNDEHHH